MRRFIKSIVKSPTGFIGLLIILVVSFIAVFAPYIAPHEYASMNIRERLSPPSLKYPFGTDMYGRDILSRIIWGARLSLQIGLISVFIGASLGLLIGLFSAYWGGIFDILIMRVIDVLMSLPLYLLAILIVAILGSSLFNVMLAVGLATFPQFARLVRGEVLSIKERVYVEAAKSIGAGSFRIIFFHILPNILRPISVVVTLRIATAILTEASLSFLGLGPPPPSPSWGIMAADGRVFLMSAPWLSIIPGIIISITVLGFNLFGDAASDILDPKQK